MARNHRGRGQVSIAYLALLSVAVLLVVVLIVRQVWRSSTAQVWVARDGIKAGETLDASKLVLASVAKDSVPPGTTVDPSIFLGKPLVHALDKGKPLTVADVTPPPPYRNLADAPPEGRVVMTIPAPANLPLSQLRYADRFELIASTPDGHVRVIGHGLIYLGAMVPAHRADAASSNPLAATVATASRRRSGGGAPSLIVAVDPIDVTSITQAQAQHNALSWILHGRQEMTSGRPVEITSLDHSGQVELITGAKREMVK